VGGNVDCRPARVGQRAYVRYKLHRQEFVSSTRMVNGHPDDQEVADQKAWIGSVLVRISTCRTRWGWRILDDAHAEVQSDGINREAEPRGKYPPRGWGVALDQAVNGRLTVSFPVCGRQATGWSGLKRVLSLPLPGKWAIGVLSWYATQFLPDDELRCREFGTASIRLGVNSYGRLTAKASDVFPVIRNFSKTQYERFEVNSYLTVSTNSSKNA
jgi:hypothetical protein